jgi:hypothetical protein
MMAQEPPVVTTKAWSSILLTIHCFFCLDEQIGFNTSIQFTITYPVIFFLKTTELNVCTVQ